MSKAALPILTGLDEPKADRPAAVILLPRVTPTLLLDKANAEMQTYTPPTPSYTLQN